MSARTDLRTKRRRAKRQKAWEGRRNRLVWIDLSQADASRGVIGRCIAVGSHPNALLGGYMAGRATASARLTPPSAQD